MSLKYVAVDGYSWQASTTSLPGLPVNTAYTFTDVTSPKVKIDNKPILLSSTIVIAGMDSSQQFTFTGGGVLTGSAQKVTAGLMPVVLENDSVDCSVTCTNNTSGVTTAGTITIKISGAGQTVMKAE